MYVENKSLQQSFLKRSYYGGRRLLWTQLLWTAVYCRQVTRDGILPQDHSIKMSPSGLNFQFSIFIDINVSSDKACFKAAREKHIIAILKCYKNIQIMFTEITHKCSVVDPFHFNTDPDRADPVP